MSIKTAKKEKDQLYADIKEIKQAVQKNDNSIQELRTSIALNKSNDKIRDAAHQYSLNLYSDYLGTLTEKAKSEAHHSFMIGIMAGAMGVMVLLTLISIFA